MALKKLGLFVTALLLPWLSQTVCAQSTNSSPTVPSPTNSTSGPDISAAGSPASWSDNPSAALKRAETEKKMVVVEVSPNRNISGKKLETETFNDPKVQEELKKAVLVKIDPDQSEDAKTMAARLQIFTYPAIVILNYKGTIVANITGFQDAPALASVLSQYEELFQNNPLGPAPPDLTPDDPLMQALAHKPDDSDVPPRTVFYYMYYRDEITVHKDGSSSSLIRVCKYIAHPEFARTEAEISGISHRYLESLQKPRFIYARIVTPGGQSQSLDFSQISDKPYYTAGDVTWDERNLTLPSRRLKQGEILDYEQMIEVQPRIPGHFELRWDCLDNRYVSVDRELILHFPAELHLNKSAVRCDVPVDETKEPNGMITWHIKSSSPPPGSATLFLPDEAERWQGYLMDTPWTWDGFATWYRARLAGRDTINQDAKDMVAQMKQETSDPRELSFRLCRWVRENIRYYPIDLLESSLQPHTADETFHYRCGDSKDKTLLLQSLLREAGIPSSPVLIASGYGSRLNIGQPMILQFNHCLIAAQIGGADVYLDPAVDLGEEGGLPLTDANTQGLKIEATKSEIVTLPPYQARKEGNTINEDVVLHDDGSAIDTAHFQFVGPYAAQLKAMFARVPEDQTKDIFAQISKKSNKTLTDFSMTDPHRENGPLAINCVISDPQFARPSGRGLMLILGDNTAIKALVDGLSQPRTTPFRFYPSDPTISRYTVTLPPGTKLLAKPDDLHLATPFLIATQTTTLEGDKLELVNTYVTKDAVIPVTQEAAVLDAFQEIENSQPATFIVSPPSFPTEQPTGQNVQPAAVPPATPVPSQVD
jgi:hypothetical protein